MLYKKRTFEINKIKITLNNENKEDYIFYSNDNNINFPANLKNCLVKLQFFYSVNMMSKESYFDYIYKQDFRGKKFLRFLYEKILMRSTKKQLEYLRQIHVNI